MLVKTLGKKTTASSMAKGSQFYIDEAKFVQAYAVVLENPNEFLKEVGEPELVEKQTLSWRQLVLILQKCDFGFDRVVDESELLVMYNYAIEIGSISKKDKQIATVDDIADAQHNYYNFVDDATKKAEQEYDKQSKISHLRDKEVDEVNKKLTSFAVQRWVAFSVSIFAVILFCLGVAGFVFDNIFVETIGHLFPKGNSQIIGSTIFFVVSIIMFYFAERWQAKARLEYRKLNYASQEIFKRSDENYFAEQILKQKLEQLKTDLETIKKELGDPEKTFDVRANIEKLLNSNEYYKKFVKHFNEKTQNEQIMMGEQGHMEETQSQEIVLEGQFDEEAYKEKFEKSRKSTKVEKIDRDEINKLKQSTESKEESAQNKTPVDVFENLDKMNANDITEEKIDEYIDYIEHLLGEDLLKELNEYEK